MKFVVNLTKKYQKHFEIMTIYDKIDTRLY